MISHGGGSIGIEQSNRTDIHGRPEGQSVQAQRVIDLNAR